MQSSNVPTFSKYTRFQRTHTLNVNTLAIYAHFQRVHTFHSNSLSMYTHPHSQGLPLSWIKSMPGFCFYGWYYMDIAHCNTLQHTATHCNTLQHTASHCNTPQHTATHCQTLPPTARHLFLEWYDMYMIHQCAKCMHICKNLWNVGMYVCMHVCVYVCMYVFMYVYICVYAGMCLCTYACR